MDIYLRTVFAPKVYLVTGMAQAILPVAVASPTAAFFSRFTIDNWNRATGSIPSDRTIKSHNLVFLRTRDGNSVFREVTSPHRLMSEGPRDVPRFYHDLFEIRKSGGVPGDVIRHGDLVLFGLAQSLPARPITWMKHGVMSDSGVRMIFFDDTNDPSGDEHLFEVLLPNDLGEFTFPDVIEVPFRGIARVAGAVHVAGEPATALPGGMPFTLTVDVEQGLPVLPQLLVAPNLAPIPGTPGGFTGTLPEGAGSAAIELDAGPHLGALGPADSRDLTLTVQAAATRTTLTLVRRLQAVRTPHGQATRSTIDVNGQTATGSQVATRRFVVRISTGGVAIDPP